MIGHSPRTSTGVKVCSLPHNNNNNNNNNNKTTRSGITKQMSCDKDVTNSNIANADCKQFDETAEHIISTCPILAKEQYTER
jgi:hypothetical protein